MVCAGPYPGGMSGYLFVGDCDQSWLTVPMRKDPSGVAVAGVFPSYCGMPPWCLNGGGPPFCASSVAVSASILRSSSATRLSAFFWRLRVGGVVILELVSQLHRIGRQ
jgi:hypothetical protein